MYFKFLKLHITINRTNSCYVCTPVENIYFTGRIEKNARKTLGCPEAPETNSNFGRKEGKVNPPSFIQLTTIFTILYHLRRYLGTSHSCFKWVGYFKYFYVIIVYRNTV